MTVRMVHKNWRESGKEKTADIHPDNVPACLADGWVKVDHPKQDEEPKKVGRPKKDIP